MLIVGYRSQRCRHRLLLLAAVHARRLRAPLLRGPDRGPRRLPQSARASSARSSSASSPAARPWRSDRSPSRRSARRSSAPRSGSSMPCRRPSPATTRRSGSRISACRPKAGARRSPSSAPFSSAARPGRACLCSSRRMVGQRVAGGPAHRCLWRQRPARGELTPHRRSVGYRRDDALVRAN